MKKKTYIGAFLILYIITLIYWAWPARPTVTVLMSTYNRGDIVSNTINSVLNQTFTDFEFLIINDGSVDNTAYVLKEFSKKDKRIVIIDNGQNLGLIASLNKGLDRARGKYIARIDDDDRMFPQRLAKQVAFMETHPDTAVLATGIRTFKYGKPHSDLGCPPTPAEAKANLVFGNGFAHSSTMFRKAFFDKHHIRYHPDFLAAEDYRLWQDIIWNDGDISCIQEPLTEYERHGGNAPGFYKAQSDSGNRTRLYALSKFFKVDKQTLDQPHCQLLDRVIEANKTLKLLDDDVLKRKKEYDCKGMEEAYFFIHPDWRGYVKIKNGEIIRLDAPTEQGAASFQGNLVTVNWEQWAPEVFICKEGNVCKFMHKLKK